MLSEEEIIVMYIPSADTLEDLLGERVRRLRRPR
jgi:hypothetical protein